MPELPDIELYCFKLNELIKGQPLLKLRIFTPFLLRSVTPTPEDLQNKTVTDVTRLGKRIVIAFDPELYLVIHLMIAGRLQWKPGPAGRVGGKIGLATLEFPNGTLALTEAGSKKRASLTIVQGQEALQEIDRGGLEVLTATEEEFKEALQRESHTVKNALTDPQLFSGIGNAYSDEILHAARLSPMKLTRSMTDDEIHTLYKATRETLTKWLEQLKIDFANRFPGRGDITAFRPDYAVHGKYNQPCPVCGSPVKRIRYADNECNYCATCQNGGKVLADRALSRLLK